MGTTIWSGLSLGAIYALVASGFNLSLVPSGVFNFAQGALVMAGAYLSYLWLATLGLPVTAAIALDILAGVLLGAACELITVRPLRWGRFASNESVELITTVGMATVLSGVAGIIWGVEPLAVPFHGPTEVVSVLGIRMAPLEIFLVAAAVVVAVGLHLWIRRTRTGQACLAVAEDRDAARLRGVNVNLLSIGAFAAAGALGVTAGLLVGPQTYATPGIATTFALSGFVAMALGGEGNQLGGLAGGLSVGLVTAFAIRYLGPDWSNISVLGALLLTLLIRPGGLAGLGATRDV